MKICPFTRVEIPDSYIVTVVNALGTRIKLSH